MLTRHQQKNFDVARADQLLSLQRGSAPTAYELIDLAVAMANSRGMEKIQTIERDPATLEVVATATIEVPTYERFQYQLSGRIQALIDFYNTASCAGVRLGFKKIKAAG